MYLKKLKKSFFFTYFVFIVLGSLLTSCEKQPEPVHSHICKIIIPIEVDPSSFDPRKITSSTDFQCARHLFTGLYSFSEKKTSSCLVEKIELSDDKRTYTIHLKKSLWSDNTPVTSKDFKESWSQLLLPNFPSSFYSIFYPIKNAKKIKYGELPVSEIGIETPSDHILIIHLEYPLPYFEEWMAFPATFPVHESQRQADLNTVKNLISNGAFTLQKWEPQNKILFQKNPFYFDKDLVSLEQIELRIIQNPTTAALMFKKGELDWLGPPWYQSVLPEIFESLKSHFQVTHLPLLETSWLACNLNTPYLSSLKVRHALSKAIDREEIIKQILKGKQLPAHRILPPSLGNEKITYPTLTDKVEAKILFEKALTENGWNKNDFSSLSLCYISSYGIHKQIAEVIQKQWQEVLGIQIKIESSELKLFLEKRAKQQYDLVLSNWIADFYDPQPFLETFQSDLQTFHYTGFNNPDFNQLIQKATFCLDAERKDLFLKAENILLKELPIFPLFHQDMQYAASQNLHNVKIFSIGASNFIHANIK